MYCIEKKLQPDKSKDTGQGILTVALKNLFEQCHITVRIVLIVSDYTLGLFGEHM